MDRLPTARNIWALLENQEPSSVTNRVDEGGIATGTVALVGAQGSTWTQNAYTLDGINLTDPFEPGKPLIYPALGGLQEFRASNALHGPGATVPAASFDMTSRAGGERFRFGAEAYYLGEPFQSRNWDGHQPQPGFTTAPRFRRFGEFEISAGGPFSKSRRWLGFGSLGMQNLSRVIPDFDGIPTSAVKSLLARLDWQPRDRDQVSWLIAGQIANNSNLGAKAGIPPSATLQGYDRFDLAQARWTHRSGPLTLSQLWFGISHSSLTDTFQDTVSEPNKTQLFTGKMSGAAPLESDSARIRISLGAQAQNLRRFPGSSHLQHLLDFGIRLVRSFVTDEERIFGDLRMLFFPAEVPIQVARFNSPIRTKQRLREFLAYVDDHATAGNRLFLRFGLTLDFSRLSLPAQHSSAGVFVPARDFAGHGSVVSWASLSPRLSVAVPFSLRSAQTRILAGFARYHHLLPAHYADYANPNSLGAEILEWRDANHDGVYQSGEEGALLRVLGGPYSSIDRQLRRPHTNEMTIGVDHRLGRRLQTALRLFRREARRLVETVNVGVPFDAYTPVRIEDLGDDNVAGTRDDQILTVYSRNPQALGKDHYLLTNPAGFETSSKGLEAWLHAGMGNRGSVSASFLAYKATGPSSPGNGELENDPGTIGTLFDDPNTLLNALGRLYFDRAYVGKLLGWVEAPGGFQLGWVIKYFDGLPFGRRLIVPGLNQGPISVMATPRGQSGGLRTQYHLTFDQRIGRGFHCGSMRCSVVVDFFNLLNKSSRLREHDISGPLFPLRLPTEILNPRAIRFGFRLDY